MSTLYCVYVAILYLNVHSMSTCGNVNHSILHKLKPLISALATGAKKTILMLLRLKENCIRI